jgi:predicted esterase
MPVSTPTAIPTLIPTATPIPTPIPIHKRGISVFHNRDEKTKFPWFSYIPKDIKSGEQLFILVDAGHGQWPCTQSESTASVKQAINEHSKYAEQWTYALLFPAIPRDCSKGDTWSYSFSEFDVWGTHLDSSIFTGDPESHNYRFDQRVIEMINELKSELIQDGYMVDDKVFLLGYSTGGNFANRFALLHPEIVNAVGAGGLSGIISLPINELNGRKYIWYNGIANFEELLNKPFNEKSCSSIAHFYFWGENDESSHCVGPDILCFSSDPVKSNQLACSYFLDLGYKVICKEYAGIGHEFTEQMHQDVFQFFEEQK